MIAWRWTAGPPGAPTAPPQAVQVVPTAVPPLVAPPPPPAPLPPPPPTTVAKDEALPPTSAAEALEGIAALQSIIEGRAAQGRETDEACVERRAAEQPTVLAAYRSLGGRLENKLRLPGDPPGFSTTISTEFQICRSCWEGKGAPPECKITTKALNDLAASLEKPR
ncbi:MAG: hypothetical protein ACLQVI_09625 [Polyangiaceae bacterium]